MVDLVCPVCEQDYVKKVKITPVQRIVILCEECRSLWETNKPVGVETRVFYADYMKQFGLQASWNYVEVISDRLSVDDEEASNDSGST